MVSVNAAKQTILDRFSRTWIQLSGAAATALNISFRQANKEELFFVDNQSIKHARGKNSGKTQEPLSAINNK